jgi:hypothetical protein
VCLRVKFKGKPDAGDPHVRFDEGEGVPSLLYWILVRQAKPGQSCELKGVHLVNCPFDK